MKVLQLTKHYPPDQGGIESVTRNLTEGLYARGIDVEVLCTNLSNVSENSLYNGKYRVIRAPSLGKIYSTSISFKLVSILRKIMNNYDIIQVHFPDPMSAIALYLCRPKAQLIVHWHSDIVKQKSLYRLYFPLQKWILNRADSIVGTSPKYIEESEQLKRYLCKVQAISIGIDSSDYVSDPLIVTAIKNKYQGKQIIFALGRLVYYKGFEYLIDAGKYILKDAVVLIGGSGSLYEELKKQIHSNNLENKVYLIGKVPQTELASYFAACDIFCLPSIAKSEAFGVVQLEAMIMNKPIVATNIPESGVSWVNADGISGFNVPPRDSQSLASAINTLLADNVLYEKMAKQAHQRYDEYFTVDKMVNSFIELYKNVLK